MLQKQNIDWDKLGFNASKTRSMWVGDCINDETWSRGALEPTAISIFHQLHVF